MKLQTHSRHTCPRTARARRAPKKTSSELLLRGWPGYIILKKYHFSVICSQMKKGCLTTFERIAFEVFFFFTTSSWISSISSPKGAFSLSFPDKTVWRSAERGLPRGRLPPVQPPQGDNKSETALRGSCGYRKCKNSLLPVRRGGFPWKDLPSIRKQL